MKLEVYEILQKAGEAKTRKDKVKVLVDNPILGLKVVLRSVFDDKIVFALPQGDVPFKIEEAPPGMSYKTIDQFAKQKYFSYLVKGGTGDRLPQVKREKMFLDMLESINPEEAEIMVAIKDKSLPKKYKGITKAVVQEAFPELIA